MARVEDRWKDPHLRSRAEKRLGVDLHFSRDFRSGQIRVVQENKGLFSRVVVHCHPHDYIWIVHHDNPFTAHKLVMMDIQKEIENSARASIYDIERLHHPDWIRSENSLGISRWEFIGGPTFEEIEHLTREEFREKYTINENVSREVYTKHYLLWDIIDCAACEGTGEVTAMSESGKIPDQYEDCPVCDGRGVYYERKDVSH